MYERMGSTFKGRARRSECARWETRWAGEMQAKDKKKKDGGVI